LLPVPAAHGSFPTLVPRSFLGCWIPYPGGTPCACTCFFHGVIGLPHEMIGSTSRVSSATNDFSQARFRGCRYFVMFRPPSLLAPQIVPTAAITSAGQPGLLRPSTSCFVASARSGYANRPNTGNWRYGDSRPARLSVLSATPISSLPSRLKETLQTAGPPHSMGVTPLRRYYGPVRHPLAFDRLPGLAGYTTYLAPVISQPGREGFTNHSMCPCHRAVASTPPKWEVPHRSDFGTPCCLRPTVASSASGLFLFEATFAFTVVTAR
jgi:hypothetical protein